MININKYILTSVILSLLCFMVSCSFNSNSEETLGTSVSTGETSGNETATQETTTIETTTTTIETTVLTSLAPTDYKQIIQTTINDYEVMLMKLNSLIQDFNGTPTWNDELQQCYDTSKQYLDAMNELTDNQSVPIKYQKSHERITYCMDNYTKSITLIQQSIEFYLADDTQNGDEYLNQALNRSQEANKVWSEIRGYGIVEYTGETLEPQMTVSTQAEQYVISDNDETYTLAIPEDTTPQTTYQQYNDGYNFGDDNVYIYGND